MQLENQTVLLGTILLLYNGTSCNIGAWLEVAFVSFVGRFNSLLMTEKCHYASPVWKKWR